MGKAKLSEGFLLHCWLLKPRKVDDPPWGGHVDTAYGFVVVARSSSQARALASRQAGDEGRRVWLDDEQTTCERLRPDAKGVVLRVFNAG